eukprot:RCo039252
MDLLHWPELRLWAGVRGLLVDDDLRRKPRSRGVSVAHQPRRHVHPISQHGVLHSGCGAKVSTEDLGAGDANANCPNDALQGTGDAQSEVHGALRIVLVGVVGQPKHVQCDKALVVKHNLVTHAVKMLGLLLDRPDGGIDGAQLVIVEGVSDGVQQLDEHGADRTELPHAFLRCPVHQVDQKRRGFSDLLPHIRNLGLSQERCLLHRNRPRLKPSEQVTRHAAPEIGLHGLREKGVHDMRADLPADDHLVLLRHLAHLRRRVHRAAQKECLQGLVVPHKHHGTLPAAHPDVQGQGEGFGAVGHGNGVGGHVLPQPVRTPRGQRDRRALLRIVVVRPDGQHGVPTEGHDVAPGVVHNLNHPSEVLTKVHRDQLSPVRLLLELLGDPGKPRDVREHARGVEPQVGRGLHGVRGHEPPKYSGEVCLHGLVVPASSPAHRLHRHRGGSMGGGEQAPSALGGA